MTRLIPTIILLLLIGTFQLNAQEDTYKSKVKKMLKLSGASENFDVAVRNMIELQRKSYQDFLSEDFFDEMEKEMLEFGLEKLIPKFTPVYRKHLTEEDLDGIITFYESEVGKKLTEKMPMIVSEAMQIGAEWGEEIGKEIYNKIQSSNEFLFKSEIETDCTPFQKGTFKSTLEGVDEVAFIERENDVQIEKLNGHQLKSKIKWTHNNKYTLESMVEDNSEEFSITEVTIYEVNEESYQYIARQNGIYIKGTIKKIVKKL